MPKDAHLSVQFTDNQHGNTLAVYLAMGSPSYPTRAQVEQINQAAVPSPGESTQLRNGLLDLNLSPNALALIEIPAGSSAP